MNPLSAIPSVAIPGTQPLQRTLRVGPAASPELTGGSAPGETFGTTLDRMVREVNAKQTAAATAVGDLMSGQNVSLHQTMISVEEANVAFQLMVEVRNKLLESYQELMRMQV